MCKRPDLLNGFLERAPVLISSLADESSFATWLLFLPAILYRAHKLKVKPV
jgi:hypothetical protein